MRYMGSVFDDNWEERYQLAKQYYKRYGNLLIPRDFKTKDGINYSEEGINLGRWLVEQRKNYSKNKITEARKRKLEMINIVWEVNKQKWAKYYTLAKEYFYNHSNLLVPENFKTNNGINYDEDGFKLGVWIVLQRRKYLTGKLNKKRIDLLEKIGMVWEARDFAWNTYYEMAKNYYEKYGNLAVSNSFKTKDGINYDEDGFKLGAWLNALRQAYKGNGTNRLLDYQIDLLNKIGMVWNFRNYNFERNYLLAKNYYEKNGNLLIPNSFRTSDGINYDENGTNLCSWVEYTRKNKTLSEKEKKLLEQIGIYWENKTDYIWNRNYELAKKYFNHYGNLMVSTSFKTNDGINYDENGVQLGNWLNTQRRVYKKNKPGVLTDEHIDLLNKIEMPWDVDHKEKYDRVVQKKWNENYELAKKYFDYYGNLDVPKYFITSNGINYDAKGIRLGNWIDTQRRTFKGYCSCKLNDEMIKKLNDLKIDWFNGKDEKIQKQIISNKNRKQKEIEILNRVRSYLLKYDGNTLPSKEELNNNFVKELKF